MKRASIAIEDIAGADNLCRAAILAARGKRTRLSVIRFFDDFHGNIRRLREDILQARVPSNRFRTFVIHDPKKRTILAACFEDRVLHHAVMNLAGPVLEKAMVGDSYACRPGKGILKAAGRVQHFLRRHPWYVQSDINGYFDSIDHQLLFQRVSEKFKGSGFLDLMKRIIESYQTSPGRGLPIGSLTSQHLANYFLDRLDRYVMETLKRPYVRYMDDMIWWCKSGAEARRTCALVTAFADHRLGLEVKPNVRINRSRAGVTYCGFRIYPGTIRPGRRQLKRFHSRRRFWESQYESGAISAAGLQAAYASVHALTLHTDSREWRKRYFAAHPAIDA